MRGLNYTRVLGMNAIHGMNVRAKDSKLSLDNVNWLIGLIRAKASGTDSTYRKPKYMSEAETRRLYIDQSLQEAGWEVLD